MRKKVRQMSLFDTYQVVADDLENNKPRLFRLLDEVIDWETLIPARFHLAFYSHTGRPREYKLISFLKMLVHQRIFGYLTDSLLLLTLRHSREMRDFCELRKVPDAAKVTRFKQEYQIYLEDLFEKLVEVAERICREMDAVFLFSYSGTLKTCFVVSCLPFLTVSESFILTYRVDYTEFSGVSFRSSVVDHPHKLRTPLI